MDSSERKLCAKGCGFFGSPSTLNLCSKCLRQEHLNAVLEKKSIHNETRTTSPEVQTNPVEVLPPEMVQDRCNECKKRVRIARGFKCRCGLLFCESHRYPEEHMCLFDYRALGKYEIAKVNPMVKADKLERI